MEALHDERPSDRVIREAIAALRPGKSREYRGRRLKPREVLDAESAARHNARNAAKWSLWAAAGKLEDVAPAISGGDVRERREDFIAHLERSKEATRRKAEALRAAVAELVSAEELAALDERRAVYPKGPEYGASVFNNELARLTGRTPLEVFEEFRERGRWGSDVVRPDGLDADEMRAALRGLVAK